MTVIWVREDQMRVVLVTWVGSLSQSALRTLAPGKIGCHGYSGFYVGLGLCITCFSWVI